jgi:hypothetical protein
MKFDEKIDKEFRKAIQKAKALKVAERGRPINELHPSSFPFCALRNAYEFASGTKRQQRWLDMRSDFFFSVGTTVHTILQRWLFRAGVIHGHLQCNDCSHQTKKLVVKSTCPKCGSKNTLYVEPGGRHGKNVVWHSDTLFQDSNGEYWVVDYKTTSVRDIQTAHALPIQSNIHQIEKYAVLYEAKYSVNVVGCLLVYVARDNPDLIANHGWRLSTKRKAYLRDQLEQDAKHYETTHLARTYGDVKRFIPVKLCASRREYLNEYHSKYNPCPLYMVCFSGNEELRAKLRQDLPTKKG